MSTPNTERLVALGMWAIGQDLRKQLGLPNEWVQAHWISQNTPESSGCGTACCIAGKVVLEDGGVPAAPPDDTNPWSPYGSARVASYARMPDGSNVYVSDYAKEVLGLDNYQAGRLFGGSNSLEDVLDCIRNFTGVDLFPFVIKVGATSGR